MSSIQRLDNAMLGKVAAVPNLDRRVKAILKTSARAHREVTNAQKWVYNPHQLMEISLMTCQPDSHVDLANMVKHGVQLTRVAGAQLEKLLNSDGCIAKVITYL